MGAGLQLKITLDDSKARAAIRGIYLRALSLKAPFEALGKWLVTRQHEHFEHEESPDGTPWKALTPAYVERPRKQGGRGGLEHPILFVHGYLESRIDYAADDTALAVGTNGKFKGGKSAGAIHQLGGTAGRGAKIPARPFLGMSRADESHGADLLMGFLAEI